MTKSLQHPLRTGLLGVLLAAFLTSLASAQEPVSVESKEAGTPHYLCLCPPFCQKPLPQLPCWNYRFSCLDYCRKPLPCTPIPCRSSCCDEYQRKRVPCCLPLGPCPPRWNFGSMLAAPVPAQP